MRASRSASAFCWAFFVVAGLLVTACAALVGIEDMSGSDEAGQSAPDGGTCTSDLILCGAKWVDPLTDGQNCGECDSGCAPGRECLAGFCLSPIPVDPDGADPGTVLKTVGPGAALVLGDGTYPPIHVDCSFPFGTFHSGTPSQPVVVVALHERQAILQSDGLEAGFSMKGCSNWVVHGLTVKSQNNAAIDGGPRPDTVAIIGGENVVLRRMLVDGTNGDYPPPPGFPPGTLALSLDDVTNAHVVESEIYDFTNDGLSVSGGSVEVKRVYINPRAAGGAPQQHGLVCFECTALIENTVVETAPGGFLAEGATAQQNFEIFGSIALGSLQGLQANGYGVFVVRDFAAIGRSDAGQFGMSVAENPPDASGFASISGVSLFYTGGAVLGAGAGTVVSLDSTWSLNAGLTIQPPIRSWHIESSNVFPGLIDPADACSDPQCVDRNPGIDQPPRCLAYVLPGSVMFDAGADGGPIGANVVDRYEDGGRTDAGLWACGGFPCGALASGINDQDIGTCRNLAARLNFVDGGCPLPGAGF